MGKLKGQARGDALVLPGYRARVAPVLRPPRPVQGELEVTLSEEQYRVCFACYGTCVDIEVIDVNIPGGAPPCSECSGRGGWWVDPSEKSRSNTGLLCQNGREGSGDSS